MHKMKGLMWKNMKVEISYVMFSGASEIPVTWMALKGVHLEASHSGPLGIQNMEGVPNAGWVLLTETKGWVASYLVQNGVDWWPGEPKQGVGNPATVQGRIRAPRFKQRLEQYGDKFLSGSGNGCYNVVCRSTFCLWQDPNQRFQGKGCLTATRDRG